MPLGHEGRETATATLWPKLMITKQTGNCRGIWISDGVCEPGSHFLPQNNSAFLKWHITNSNREDAPISQTNLCPFREPHTYHPPASQERLGHWINSPASPALITAWLGLPWQARRHSREGEQSDANTLETGIAPDWQVIGVCISPVQSCSVFPISTVCLFSQQPSDTGKSILHLVQMGNRGRERALTLLSWNEASAHPPEGLEQHLFAQKFCSKKKTFS